MRAPGLAINSVMLRGPRAWAPYVVLIVSLLVSGAATGFVARTLAARDHVRFNNSVRHAKDQIAGRIDTYIGMLRGGNGLFASKFPIKPEEFRTYCSRLEIPTRFPGIEGMGFSVRFKPEDRKTLIGVMRAIGFPNFDPHPATHEDEHHAIVYLEPFNSPNVREIGFDMYSDPIRRAAMQRARDTGTPTASAILTLPEETEADLQRGFVIYTAVYTGGEVPENVPERRKRLIGFVYCPFRAHDLFRRLFLYEIDPELDFEVFDATTPIAQQLLYRSSELLAQNPQYMMTTEMRVAGRSWTLRFRTRPEFQATAARWAIPGTAIGTLLLSFALFFFTRSQVNARLRAERLLEKLRRSQLALRRSESKFRRISDSNLVGVLFSRLNGPVIDGNEEAFRMLGFGRDEGVARLVQWSALVLPEHRAAVDRAVAQLQSDGVVAPFEIELPHAGGGQVPVLTGGAMLDGVQGDCVWVIVDLSRIKEAERALVAAKETADAARLQAETANRLKDEFLATVSHELRTPLNAILGWTQLLSADHSNPADVEHGLEVIERNARSQTQLVDDLLDVSRIIAGKLRLEVQPLDLAAVVDAAVQSIRPTADIKGVSIEADLQSACGQVSGDASRLGQVVWNLLSNAVKFTPRGATVSVSLRQENQEAVLTVRDTGKGIAPDFLPYVFERFRQADSSSTRKYGGLGLGLGIVQHFVQLHGGTVEAASPGEGKGATFTVRLPITTKSAGVAKSPAGGNGRGSLSGLSILLVEDEQDARELIQRFLTEADAQVTTVNSAADALRLFPTLRPGVLVSDISMPDEDGYSLMRKVRAAEQSGDHTPAIALTAYARPEDRERAIAAGFDLHLAKPIRAADLVASVVRLSREHSKN